MSDKREFRMLECEDGGVIYFLSNGVNEYHPPGPLRRLWFRIKRLFTSTEATR